MDTSASVVQEINMSYTLSVPPGVASGANWDAQIFNFPDFASVPGTGTYGACSWNPNTGSVSGVAGVCQVAGIGVLSGPSGCVFAPFSSGSTTVGCTFTGSASIDPGPYLSGKCRLVASAFEVLNTTAPLYRQGLVTAYRLPQLDSQSVLSVTAPNSSAGSGYATLTVRQHALWPSNSTQALLLPGSKQWSAERGSYSVVTQCDLSNNPTSVETVPRMCIANSVISAYGNVIPAMYQAPTLVAPGGACTYSGLYHSSCNTSGVIFSGLSNQTTLQVNAKFIIETMPGPNSNLVTLAQPSPPYDPEALRLYSRLCCHLPVAVPADENPDGEWFQQVLGTLGSLANMAGGINPIFRLVGTGLGVASSVAPHVYRAIMDSKKPSHKEKKQTNQNQQRSEALRANIQRSKPKAPVKQLKRK